MNNEPMTLWELGEFTPSTYGIWINASLEKIDSTVEMLENGELRDQDVFRQHLTLQHEVDHFHAFISTPLGFFLDQIHIALLDNFVPIVQLAQERGPFPLHRPLKEILDRYSSPTHGGALEKAMYVLQVNLHKRRVLQKLFGKGRTSEVVSWEQSFDFANRLFEFWIELYYPGYVFPQLQPVSPYWVASVALKSVGLREVVEGLARSLQYAAIIRTHPDFFDRFFKQMHFGEYAAAIDAIMPAVNNLTTDALQLFATLRATLDLALYAPFVPTPPSAMRSASWVEFHPGLRLAAIAAQIPRVGLITSPTKEKYMKWVAAICDMMDPPWLRPWETAEALVSAKQYSMSRLATAIESKRLAAAQCRIKEPHFFPLYFFCGNDPFTKEALPTFYPPLTLANDGFASGDLPEPAVGQVVIDAAVVTAREEVLFRADFPATSRLLGTCTFDQVTSTQVHTFVEQASGIKVT